MRPSPHALRVFVPLSLVVALALAGCGGTASEDAGDTAGSPSGDRVAAGNGIAAEGTVAGQGTVLQLDGQAPQLCLGAVAESYPPQCGGPEVVGWDWDAVDLEESASGVTWGAYAVTGTWDGARFTVTDPAIPLALYDPMMSEPDPRTDPANAGASSGAELVTIQDELTSDVNAGANPWPILTSWPENGYLFVTVEYDDGTIQSYYDDLYGPDTIAIQSALRDLE
jgi:hypothetical protein